MLKTKNKASSGGLTLKHKFGYGLGDAGGCMTFALMDGIFGMYCTDALGIDPTVFGILLLIWNIWDFVNDPIMGALMDKSFAKSQNPNGKFRPWLLRSAPLVCVTFIALFIVPSFFQGIGLVCVLFACKILYEGSYTMFNIPMGSLLSAMADSDHERASLSSARGIGSGVGNMFPIAIVTLIVNSYGNTSPVGYAIGASIFAVVGFVLCLGHYAFTEERFKNTTADPEAQNVKMTDILHVFRVNRPFLALCLHGLFFCMVQALGNTFNFYLYEHVYGGLDLATQGMIVSMPIMLITYIFGPKIAKKLGLVKFIRYALIVGSVIHVLLFAAHAIVYVNPYVHMIISNFALGLASMSVYMQWGLVGEAIDYNEMITGKRTEGSIYGTFNLFRRIGKTFSASLGMFMLSWFGYNGKLEVQSDLTVFGIKLLSVLLPGLLILGSWIAFKYVWNMTDATRAQLAEFKAAQKAPVTDEVAEA